MGCYHDATAQSIGAHHHLWAVIERPDVCTFWATELLIWGKRESKLDLGSQKDLVIFTPHDKRQSSHVREGGSRSIEPIQSQQHAICRDLIRNEVLLDLGYSTA